MSVGSGHGALSAKLSILLDMRPALTYLDLHLKGGGPSPCRGCPRRPGGISRPESTQTVVAILDSHQKEQLALGEPGPKFRRVHHSQRPRR